MSEEVDAAMKKVAASQTLIQNILSYDPQMIFSDTFERILHQLNSLEELYNQIIAKEKNYWCAYNIVIEIMSILEKLVFFGYSDQILEYSLSLFHSISTYIIFRTSRFIPFRMQFFYLICSAMANTQNSRDKDAENFINTFKSELTQLMQLEQSNTNGLAEKITTCNGDEICLKDLFDLCFNSISVMLVHFTTSADIEYEKPGSNQKAKQRGKKQVKEDTSVSELPPLPSQKAVEMVINAFESPLSKQDYLNKYSSIIQAWVNPACNLEPILLHRLLFAFIRSGNFNDTEALSKAHPDDPIVTLAQNIAENNWMEVSVTLTALSNEIISTDYQFFYEIAMRLWNIFANKKIQDPLVLRGFLRVLFVVPNPCPMHVTLAALHLCWHLESLDLYGECIEVSRKALDVLLNFRDIYATRKFDCVISPTEQIPTKPADKAYLLFENWLECLHVDLLSVWISATLRFGLINDTDKQAQNYEKEIQDKKDEYERTKQLYGILDNKQKQHFDEAINRPFKPPAYSKTAEEELLTKYKNNFAVKALIYIQMSFFRPQKAEEFLEKARQSLIELESITNTVNSPIIFATRTQIALSCSKYCQNAKTVAVFGKEVVGNTGLTTSNTYLQGCGIKQDKVEAFLISKLKPNTLYTFAFGGYNSHGELIDTLSEPFYASTSHTLSVRLIWSYIAAAAYRSKDLVSFDVALTYLIQCFAEIAVQSEDNMFYQYMNPFNRFILKSNIISEPAPLIRSFASVLLMSARLFASKPLHATSFQHLSLILAQILNNPDLILTGSREILATLQPLIGQSFHVKWVIQPLLLIINALKNNKPTRNEDEHQQILACASYCLDNAFVKLYQERQISQYVLSTILELPTNSHWRQSFIMFAAQHQLVDSSITNEQVLPTYAAEMFRQSPDKSFDECFNKFRLDSLFPAAVVYLITMAHTAGMNNQGVNWSKQALEFVKSLVHEQDDSKANPKKSGKGAKPPPKKKPPIKGKKQDTQKQNTEEALQNQMATKIQNCWMKHHTRQKKNQKFYECNQHRAALLLLSAMCQLELDETMKHAKPVTLDNSGKVTPKHQQRKSLTSAQRRRLSVDASQFEAEFNYDAANNFLQTVLQTIVIGYRSKRPDIQRAATHLLRVFMSTVPYKSPIFKNIAAKMVTFSNVLVHYLPLEERWAQSCVFDIFMFLVNDDKQNALIGHLQAACAVEPSMGKMLWMIDGQEIPDDLQKVLAQLQRRDPAENAFYMASDMLYKLNLDSPDACNLDRQVAVKNILDIAINLQHKQKLSMSTSLLTRLGFYSKRFYDHKNALKRWQDALECHFRLVRAYEKVDQLLQGETEESFYQKHSWAGCLSIFVLASYIAMSSERQIALPLCKLAAFAIGSLFANESTHPKKQIDFATYEPSEIVQGVDIFSELDPNQPLLECVPAQNICGAITYLLSAMQSYELFFEMFKPIAFARHFFRFIVREQGVLARVRLIGAFICCNFGFVSSAVIILNDTITNFGQPHNTQEFTLTPPNVKRFQYDQTEGPSFQSNSECIKYLTSPTTFNSISATFGAQIFALYILCVSRLLCVLSSSQNPIVENTDSISTATTPTTKSTNSRSKHRKSNVHHKKEELTSSFSMTGLSEISDSLLKLAEQLLTNIMTREFGQDQMQIKYELMLELARVRMHMWMWESAMSTANSLEGPLKETNSDLMSFDCSNILDKSMNLVVGLERIRQQIIAECAFYVHDISTADRYGSPYMKALVLIQKAEFEQAAKLLLNIAMTKPITRFYREHVVSCAQLVTLFCFDKQLIDSALGEMPQTERQVYSPIALAQQTCESVEHFYVTELAMRESKNLYLCDTHLIVRLQYLYATANIKFKGNENSLAILEKAANMMTTICPYQSHGLSFLIASTASRIKMQDFLTQNPTAVQFWNKDVEGESLKNVTLPKFSGATVDMMSEAMRQMFATHPDCVVHPASQQAILDLVLLVGLSQAENNRRERTLSVLTIAHAVKTSRRFIQSLVSECPDSPSTTCPQLLQNDNNSNSARNLAAAYYSHVCSLDQPIFDASLIESRTFLFFRCFEEQCAVFKSLSQPNETNLDAGYVVGQWYKVDSRAMKVESGDDNATQTIRTARTGMTGMTPRTTTSGASRATTATGGRSKSSGVSGIFYYWLGTVTLEEEAKNTGMRIAPVIIVAQANDISELNAEMSDVGLTLQELSHMEKVAGTTEVPTTKEGPEKLTRKKTSVKLMKSTSSFLHTSTSSANINNVLTPLKNQVEQASKSATAKWGVAQHKLEALLTKSAKLVAKITTKGGRWRGEIKANALAKESAVAISHLLSLQFGICEKDEGLASFIYTLTPASNRKKAEPSTLPSLKL